jgi:tetratricopeptide (TPR) repeat protein
MCIIRIKPLSIKTVATRMASGIFGLCLLAGCAGQAQFEAGKEAMRTGQYDRAVTEFRAAVEQNPGNRTYVNNLAEAESRASDFHIARARGFLTSGDAVKAKQELDIALDYVPSHPEAMALMPQVEAALANAGRTDLIEPQESETVSQPLDPGETLEPEPPPTMAERSGTPRSGEMQFPVNGYPPPPSPQPSRPPAERTAPVPPPVDPQLGEPADIVSPPVPSYRRPPSQDRRSMRFAYQGTVSRDDDRYPKEELTVDGIRIKVKDTDESPLDADLEIKVRGREFDRYDVREDQAITIRGDSRALYRLIVIRIEDEDETVYYGIEPLVR